MLYTYNMCDTLWNNACLIDVKDKHVQQCLNEVAKYLCQKQGKEIMERKKNLQNK